MKKYNKEFKKMAVELSNTIGYSKATKKLRLGQMTISRWAKELKQDEVKKITYSELMDSDYSGYSEEELREILRLKIKISNLLKGDGNGI